CLMLLMSLGAIGQEQPAGGSPDAPSGPAPVPAVRQADNLAVITIEGGIDGVTLRSVQRRIKLAEEAGADAIVIELNTPGGEVPAVTEITTALKGTNLHTIAWVNPQAYSGGAIIALACDEIVVSSNATMGDAGIIQIGMGKQGIGMQKIPANERAKITAPLIADLVDSARRNGHDEVLVQAFSTLGVETWQVRNKQTGRYYFLTDREYKALFKQAPPRTSEPYMASGGEINLQESGERIYKDDGNPRGESLDAGYTPGSNQITPGMISATNLALNAKGTPGSTRPNFANENPDDYEYVRYATDGNSFLTLTTPGLKEFGFAKAEINTDEELRQFTGTPPDQMVRLNQTWSESVVQFLTQGPRGILIRGVLIVLFLLCMFIELSMPGAGVFGVIALVALGGLVIPPMMINASGWWPAVAVVGGVLLLGIEIFILPGTGVAGISGLLLVLGGLIGTFAGSGELFPGQNPGSGASLAWAASIVLLGVFAAGVGMYLFSRYTQYVPIVNMLILQDPPRPAESMLSAMGEKIDPDAPAKVGDTGVTTTRLMPSGQAEINGVLVDVIAEHGAIDQGQPIRVVSATRYRVAVEQVEEGSVGEIDESTPEEGGQA
ncbi:MAG: nodulation protein NfeD, partial [Phycisphaerales bacterium JB065]